MDLGDAAEHTVLHPEISVVLEEDDTVGRREGTGTIVRLEGPFSRFDPAGKFPTFLERDADLVVDRPNIDTAMRHRHTARLRMDLPIGEIVGDECAPGALARVVEPHYTSLRIGAKTFRRAMGGEGDRRLP